MIRATINGVEREFEGEPTILEAAREMGIDIPTLCHDPRIEAAGSCRLCIVEVEGVGREVASCAAKLSEGARVRTHTARIESARRWNLRMLAADYPMAAFREWPDKPFHKLAREYGLTEDDFGSGSSPQVDHSHTYIDADMSRCINCYACSR